MISSRRQKTSIGGEFSISGWEDEHKSIQPYLVITHTCFVEKSGCKRISEFDVPDKYVGKTYEMKYIALDIQFGKDKEVC
uniref:Uncharacterized protein n=1 Tax=Caenorhabditis japonica TaxID=281687 RepID=A0A8R1IZ79_CAEJA